MHAPHHPLVVLAAVPADAQDDVPARLREIGARWRAREGYAGARGVVFAWMDAERWAVWLKSLYGIKAEAGAEPTIVIADHDVRLLRSLMIAGLLIVLDIQRLIYYDKDQDGQPIRVTSASIFATLDDVANGTLRAKHSENIVERLARVRLITLTIIVYLQKLISAFPVP